ncbi:MAG: hypothetical protein DI582_06475 [Azospirillum brasilense]|nr:MAG: hypothetical protein DI582_06475 [Azospirillum brasilense]
MLLGFAFAPLLGSLLFALLCFPALLLMGEGLAGAVIAKPALAAEMVGGMALFTAENAYNALIMFVPLAWAMRMGGYHSRPYWIGAGLLLAQLVAYGDLYAGIAQPFGMVFAVLAVSAAGLACGFMFWVIACYLPMKDAQANAITPPPA